jgi:hypothetical protein
MRKSSGWIVFALVACLPAAAQAAAPATAACDRECLLRLGSDYLAALAAKDASRVPYASDVKIVENAKRIRAGEGLWKNTTARAGDYRILVPDAVSQQVGGIVIMEAEGKPSLVGFRLKLDGGRISEAEHLVAAVRPEMLATTLKTLRPGFNMEVPYEYADSRGRLLYIAKSYYDALDWNNGNLAPFAPDCDRLENGMRTAPSGGIMGGSGMPGARPRPPSLKGMNDCTSQINSQTFQYIDTIDNRRVEIADEKLGLVLGLSHFRHSMTQKEFPILGDPSRTTNQMNFAPFDLPAMHIYKIWGGQIHEIEAIGFQAPYNSPTGWE